jgi:hypothetical protein
VDIVKMDLRKIEWGGMDWINLAHDRDHLKAHVDIVMHLKVPLNAEKFLNSCTIGGFLEEGSVP